MSEMCRRNIGEDNEAEKRTGEAENEAIKKPWTREDSSTN